MHSLWVPERAKRNLFIEKATVCSCGKSLKVYKTQKRTIVTLQIGELIVHETIKQCSYCDKKYRTKYLKDKVSHGCKFGFDILVYVGKALFIEFRGRKEVQNSLKAKNVKISLREIGLLGKKFILCGIFDKDFKRGK